MKHRYRILIVDENEQTLQTLKNLLEGEGYSVEITQSGSDAFEKVQNGKYHIALINTALNQMDGVALLQEIRNYDPMTQMIMMSEDASMDTLLSALEHGANDYIYRPLENEKSLTRAIDFSVEKLERWRDAIKQIIV